MDKGIYTISYLITIFLVTIYLFDAQRVRSCRNIGFPSYIFVEILPDQFIVRNEEEYLTTYESLDDFSGIAINARPQYKGGPLKEGFTFFATTSFMSDLSSVHIYDWGEHSEQQIQHAFDEAVSYAKVHPYYAEYQPGEPPKTVIYPAQAAKAGAGLLGVLTLPALVSWILCTFAKAHQESSYAYRRRHSQCIHCAYSIKGLSTPTCPECGQFHSSVSDFPA